MKAKFINNVVLEGRVYEAALEKKTSAKGVDYIKGKVKVATDDACLNVVEVVITYVAEKKNDGGANPNWAILSRLMTQDAKTVLNVGAENAQMLKVSTNVGVNDWYKSENDDYVLVSGKQVAGGFLTEKTQLPDESLRNKFDVDMVITNTFLVEGDEEQGTVDKLKVKGYVFDFRKSILPVDFSVVNPNGIKFIENLDATQNTPVFTKVWGKIVNETVTKKVVEDNAFGEDLVTEVTNYKRDWVITGIRPEAYEMDDESTITFAELSEALNKREIMLAEKKQETIEWAKKKAQGNGAPATNPMPAVGNFGF